MIAAGIPMSKPNRTSPTMLTLTFSASLCSLLRPHSLKFPPSNFTSPLAPDTSAIFGLPQSSWRVHNSLFMQSEGKLPPAKCWRRDEGSGVPLQCLEPRQRPPHCAREALLAAMGVSIWEPSPGPGPAPKWLLQARPPPSSPSPSP